MNKPQLPRAAKTKIGLRHLLGLTTLVAMAVAVSLAYRLNRSLIEKRDSLLVLSTRPSFTSDSKLAWAPMPRVADDFYSWYVSVPPGPDHELRLGIGLISERGIPPIVGKVIIPAGQHRVTLFTATQWPMSFVTWFISMASPSSRRLWAVIGCLVVGRHPVA